MDVAQLKLTKTAVMLIALVLLYLLEMVFPFYLDRKGKFAHGVRNLGLGLFNAVVIAVLFTSSVFMAERWSFTQQYGILNVVELPLLMKIILMILLFDLWMYVWHVANHKIPLLWRFHRVHHSDDQVDVTSALRFHTGEIVLSTVARLGIIAILGLRIWHIILYEIFLLPVIMFHHSNVAFPERWDKLYRIIFVSPHMHWGHHSDIPVETDSNYSSIFSWWDRIFATYRLREDPHTIHQGLKQFRDQKWNQFVGMLVTPFLKKK
ncbi:MAG: sterol desaturase family protein [Acidiferrobacterales bacterium]